jgi:hypothetical protein
LAQSFAATGTGSIPWLCQPGALIAAPVQLTVMQPADRNGEAVAHFPPHRPLLRELDVVGIRGAAAADQARLGGNKFQMLAIAVAYRFADHRDGLGAGLGLLWRAIRGTRPLAFGRQGRSLVAERAQPFFKGGFDRLGIRE